MPEMTSTGALDPAGYVLPPDAGRHLMLPAGPMTLKIDSETSGGTIAIWQDVVGPSSGPPLHIHHKADEIFFVISGEFEFHLDGQVYSATTGSFVFVPRGKEHTYRCTGVTPGTLLGIVTPSGLEQFYIAQSRVPAGSLDSDAYEKLGREYDLDAVHHST